VIEKSTVRERRKLDYRQTKKAKGKAIVYLWYNGLTSFKGRERVEEREVKARSKKRQKKTDLEDPKRSELPMSKLKC